MTLVAVVTYITPLTTIGDEALACVWYSHRTASDFTVDALIWVEVPYLEFAGSRLGSGQSREVAASIFGIESSGSDRSVRVWLLSSSGVGTPPRCGFAVWLRSGDTSHAVRASPMNATRPEDFIVILRA
jgi:hypothetical protein